MYCFLCFSLSHLDCVSDFPSTSKQPRAPQLRSQLLHLLSLQVGTTFPSNIDFQLLDNLVVVKHWHMILHCSAEIRRAFVSLFKQCSGVFKGKQALSESAWTIWRISSLRMAGSNYYRHGHLTVGSARQGCYQKSMLPLYQSTFVTLCIMKKFQWWGVGSGYFGAFREKATYTPVYNAAISLISGLIMLRGANWLLLNFQLSHVNLIFLTVVSSCKNKTTCLSGWLCFWR